MARGVTRWGWRTVPPLRRTALPALLCAMVWPLSATAWSAPVLCTGDHGLDHPVNAQKCPLWVAVDPVPNDGLVRPIHMPTDVAAGEDLVFVATDAVVPGGTFTREILVAAHDRHTGLPAWEYWAAADESRPSRAGDLALTADAVAVVGTQDLTYPGPTGAERGVLFAAVVDAATGEERWASHVEEASAYAAAVGGDERLYVAGYRGHGDAPSPLVVAYDVGTGDVVWQATTDDPADVGEAIAVETSPDGQFVYVTVQGKGPAGASSSRALAAADGATLWTHEHTGRIAGSALAPDGATLYVVGDELPGGPDEPAQWLTAVSTADSVGGPQRQERWRREFESRQLYPSRPLTVDPSGERVYLAGIEGVARHDTVEAYSAGDGATLWSSSFGLPTHWNHLVVDIAVSDDGGLYLVGQATPLTTRTWYRSEMVTARFDAVTGEPAWVATYSSEPLRPVLVSTDMASVVAVHPDGRTVYTGGSVANARQAGRAVVAYDTAP